MARSAGLNPDDVVLALIDRGVEVDDPQAHIEGVERKAARATIRELLGGPTVIRPQAAPPTPAIAPAPRSSKLLGTLSTEDAVYIHERLCEDFAATDDPIDPPGVRSYELLESAVARQESGYAGLLKYHDPVLNAATLLYGICNDHPFHNGNKRTALVAMLAHLDRNRLYLKATRHRELVRLMTSVASHSILERPVKIGRDVRRVPRRGTPDEEVRAIEAWLAPRVAKITRGEASITYRELRQVLDNFGFVLRSANQKVAICHKDDRGRLFSRRPKSLMTIDWPGDGRSVGIAQIKHIRQTLGLCERDGVTRDVFYSRGVPVDAFINEYRVVLRQLASR